MCFGSSQKSNNRSSSHEEDLNSRPAPYQNSTSKTKKMPQEIYAPPAGPPPGYHNQYAPPAGPPPSHLEQYAPPSGPPPSQHNWQAAVPDTSLLPPPPSVGYERSPTNNATEAEANSAEEWLKRRPLQPPLDVDRRVVTQIDSGDVALNKPPGFSGEFRSLKMGSWKIKTKAGSPDSCMISNAPLYSVKAHSPLQTNMSKTIYFEVKILPSSRAQETSLGLGFVAMPYPPFRLPGWERASLGVHGDDGHRYVNDKWGGRDFTQPFKRGQTVGIGMTFSRRDSNRLPAYSDQPVSTTSSTPINIEVFFMKDGKKDGEWNIHEDLDAVEDLPVTGLEGMHDLYAAVGTFDAVEFEVNFSERDWLYKP